MSDASWILDIAANMPGGQQTIAELDALTESLTGAGRKSDAYQQAIKQLSDQLDVARAASAAANDALAEGNAQYTQLERDAVRAAKALERANNKNVVPVALKEQADAAQAALQAYGSTLAGLEKDAMKAAGGTATLEKQLGNVEKIGKRVDDRNKIASQQYGKLARAVAFLPGPLGRIGSEMLREAKAGEDLARVFGATTSHAIEFGIKLASVAIGLAVVTTAATVAFAAFIAYGVHAADATREMQLQDVALASLDVAHRNAVASFDAVTDATGATHAQLVALTAQLTDAHVAAAQMPAALRAAALAEQALGNGGAQKFIEKIRDGELSVRSFAQTADAKFSGVVAEKMRGLGAQAALFGRRFKALFDGVNLDPILNAVGILSGMFDKTNPLARAFAAGINAVFGVVSDNAESAAYAIEAFGLRVAIDIVKTYLFFRKYGGEIKNILLGITIALGVAAVAWAVINAGVIAEFAATAAAAVVSGAAAAAAWLVAAAPALLFIAAIGLVGYAIGELITHWSEFKEGVQLIWSDLTAWLSAKVDAFVEIGGNLIAGLVRGITGAAGAVVDAVSNTVTGAVDAAKNLLGIHSPSTVFAAIGTNTAQGYTDGVEAGTPEAQGSVAKLVDPAGADAPRTASASASRAPAPAAARGGFDLSGATFHFYGIKDAETARDRLAEMFTSLLEGDADSLTGNVPAPV